MLCCEKHRLFRQLFIIRAYAAASNPAPDAQQLDYLVPQTDWLMLGAGVQLPDYMARANRTTHVIRPGVCNTNWHAVELLRSSDDTLHPFCIRLPHPSWHLSKP